MQNGTVNNPVKNSIVYFTGSLAVRVVTLISFVLLTRYLGDERWGIFNYAMVYVSFFAVLMEISSENVLIRSLSAKPEETELFVSGFFTLKIFLSLFTFLISISAIWLFAPGSDNRWVLLIMACNIFFSFKMPGIKLTFDSIFKARLDVRAPVIFEFISAVLFLLTVFLATRLSFNLKLISVLYVASWVPGFLGLAWYARRYVRYRLSWNTAVFRFLLRESWPVMAHMLIMMIAKRFDLLLLTHFKGFQDVGIYSAAVRISDPLSFISVAIVISLYPLMSAAMKDDSEGVSRTFLLGFKVIILLIAPIAGFIFLFSPWIIHILYGEAFALTAPAVSILMIAQLFLHINVLLYHYLLSQQKQKINLFIMFIMALASVISNVFLMPVLGVTGACISAVITEFVGFGLGIYFSRAAFRNVRYGHLGSIFLLNAVFIYFLDPTSLVQTSFSVIILAAAYYYLIFKSTVFSGSDRKIMHLT